MELLERIVGEHVGTGTIRDLQDERVAATDGPGRRGDEFAVEDGLFETREFGRIDPVTERRVDDHDDDIVGPFGDERGDGFVELLEAGDGSAFGGDVRSVNNECGLGHDRY